MSKTTSAKTEYSFGPLYDLLMDKFPDVRTGQGIFNIPKFAKSLKVSAQTIYAAVGDDKLSVKLAKKIIKESERVDPIDPITQKKLLKYIFA